MGLAVAAAMAASSGGHARADRAGRASATPVARKALEARLIAAQRAGDIVRLERAADALGPVRLQAALESRNARLRAAAIVATPTLEAGALLLDALVARARVEASAGYVEAALAGVRRIAEGLRPALMRSLGLRPPMLAPLLSPLIAIALDSKRSATTRVAAIAALAQLGETVTLDPARLHGLLSLLGSGVATAIRRAAVELFVGRSGASPHALRVLAMTAARDGDKRVARAAAAALCSRLPRYGWRARRRRRAWRRRHARSRAKASRSRPAAPPALAALAAAPGGLERVRALADSASTSRDRRIELGRCLRWLTAAGDREARRTLRRLRRQRWFRRALWRVR